MVIVAGRYLLLLGTALWIGLPVAVLLQNQILARVLAKPQAHDLTAAVIPAMDRLLLFALGLTLAGQVALASLARTLPPNPILIVFGALFVLRLLGAFAISTALRALRLRVRDVNPSESDRRAFTRLHGTSLLLLGIEGVLAMVLLFLVT